MPQKGNKGGKKRNITRAARGGKNNDTPATQTGSQSAAGLVAMRKNTIAVSPAVNQFFADEYHAVGCTTTNQTNAASTGSVFVFKLNGPFNAFGPRLNNSGGFATNVPAGSIYLLSNNAATGAGAPYGLSTVIRQEVEIETIMNPSQGVGCRVVMFPSLDITNAGMGIGQAQEQNGACWVDIPANQSVPTVIKGIYDLSAVFGVSRRELRDNVAYAQPPGSDPANIAYLAVLVNSIDGTTNFSANFVLRFRTHFIFRRQNQFQTGAPS
jgi:hypothetical protein